MQDREIMLPPSAQRKLNTKVANSEHKFNKFLHNMLQLQYWQSWLDNCVC